MFIDELNLDLDILLREFIEQESELLIVNASEQAIASRLARLIEQNIANGMLTVNIIGICPLVSE